MLLESRCKGCRGMGGIIDLFFHFVIELLVGTGVSEIEGQDQDQIDKYI